MLGMDDEVRITLRLPGQLHVELTVMAQTQRRSLNAEIVRLLELAAASGSGPEHGAMFPQTEGRGVPHATEGK